MNKKEKAKIVAKHLEHLYPNPPIPLTHKDPFTLLIAVVLSAQCTDARVNLVTPALFARADTPEKMAALPIETLEPLIRTCGLSRAKAKHIQRLSEILATQYQGQVPKTLEELKSLPGVGQKTASVVLAQAFNLPAIGVDTHILRCAQRWGLSKSKNPLHTEMDLKNLYPKAKWRIIHLQMIYYARAYCPARGHKIENCPICLELAPSNHALPSP